MCTISALVELLVKSGDNCTDFLGCLNGGGQLRQEGEESSSELLSRVETVYQSIPVRDPWNSDLVSQLYVDWLGGVDSEAAKERLHTRYRAVPKMTHALSLKW